nr:N-6 DNA methylase [Fusicatenibacter saccharivorans]
MGSSFEHGKYRIYSYFLQGHSNKERADFLKQEYGIWGSGSDYLGEKFNRGTSAKGYFIKWKDYETTLKWTAVAKRIEELISVGRYMTEKELEYIPEYEKGVLARGIYNFFYHQPETFLRPYPYGSDYHRAIDQIRPQLDDPNRVKEILSMMEEVLAGTADYDQRYPSMQQAHQDLTDYRDGAFSLFTPIPAERENTQAPPEPVPAQSREEVLAGRLNAFYQAYDWYEYQDTIDPGETQEDVLRQLQEQLEDPQSVQEIYSYLIRVREGMDTEGENYSEVSELIAGIADLPAMNPPYDLQVDTIVTIGTKEYSIDFISDEMVVLRDQMYPLFTEEMPREVFDRRVRENPANDHLKVYRKPSEEPAEKDKEEPAPTQEMAQEQEDGFTGIKPEDNPFEKEPEEVLEDLAPAWAQKKPAGRVRGFDLHPEIPQESRSQYRITDEHLGEGTAKEKFRANLMAIQLLKKCEEENRFATPKEQEILSGYVGWGGLSDAFDETKSSWSTEYLELKTVLTEEEYAAARQSTLTAFYTPPVVISAMYQALENMGLKSGNILEPSCGTGNFIGRKPESLSDCKVYGVEIDSISARIAQQLYQKSTIAAQGFEDADLPDSFFDVVIGNVPFGSYKVLDRKYDKYNFLIHDYFIAKSIDKTRPKGVLALITSNGISGGTMDKRDDRVRRYIAQRCDLLGAIRLPNNAFLANAGTEINTDILFFQKRETPRDLNVDLPDWVEVERLYENDHVNEQGESRHRVVSINPYFQQHPEMVLGEQEIVSGPYGPQLVCKPYPDRDLKELLEQAVENLEAEITDYEAEELVEEEDHSIPADPSVANFSYTVYDGKIYYRENSRMKPVELSVTAQNRVKGMIAIRDCTRELIAYQTEGYPDEEIERQQKKLNHLYDLFQRKYGLLNSRANSMAFSDDSSYPLLCSLEIVAEDGTLERKADMFTKRTIKPHETVTKVDTASEALSLSLSEKACVDMEYLCSLTGKSAGEVEEELKGVIFRLPESEGMEQPRFVSEDEYLSGNVRKKLREAKQAAEISETYRSNVEALEKVQPKDLTASEISVRLGATWIPESDIADFMFELLQTPNYSQWKIKVHFSRHTGEWNIEGKSMDRGNPRVTNTYGTNRVNAYKIIEDTLNLRDTRVFDYVEDEEGKRKPILNRKETAIAQGKQDLIKQAFQEWIWRDPERRQRLTADYNEQFNSIRPREYDGSHLHFYGMNPEITLRKHQKDGVARIIYGGNTLLAYVVGAGKTYTMVAAAMECKRLGLCNKSMVVVPNHIIEQFAAEWLQLYPAANILVATKKDFEKKNRKKFCGRIATSDIDAVIIGHSQFEKIPLSVERQERMLQMEIDEIIEGIAEAKKIQGSRFTVKQMERTKKSLETRLKRLHDQSRKDDMITFEELGVDRLFVDEADGYKNLYLTTKMRNVGGVAQTEAQKSSDMYMKCRYLDEITGGKGVIFSTGTPVSNSMIELYTMQRYLQYGTLAEKNLQHFDAWASTFGETVTALEIAPEGNGYRLKTRFARFYNLPELMQMFREVADIQTADMLNLPVPEAEYRVVKVKPTELQEEMVEELGNRAERVRNNEVNPREDNMLKITNDGRKLALDQRLSNPLLPDDPGSKVNACVEEIYRHWEDGKEKKLTQLVFCDLSTPKTDGTFSVYNDIREKLLARGIPPEEIAFIHDANTDVRKKELFSKVRRGAVRILMGSTFKMGAGTNVQDRIIASHDLDCPWRPRDLEQRAGRTIRQGNQNPKVEIIRYVTEGTFDAYLYQTIENKQKYISQIMTSKSPARSVEDIDEVALSYAEIKALATGNPHIKEKMDLDIQVSRLQLLKQSFLNQKYEMEDKVAKYFPEKIRQQELLIRQYEEDIQKVKAHTPTDREAFPVMQIGDHVYTEKKEAGQAIIEACKAMKSPEPVPLGTYRGLSMELSYSSVSQEFVIALHGKGTYKVPLGTDIYGNITRLDNKMNELPDNLTRSREQLETAKSQLETAKAEAQKEFPQEKELAEKVARLGELNVLLDMDKKDRVVMEEEPETEEIEPEREKAVWVR